MPNTHPLLAAQRTQAQKINKSILFPEAALDPRTLEAVRIFAAENLGTPIVIGSPTDFPTLPPRIKIIDPTTFPHWDTLISHYQSRRAKDGLTDPQVRDLLTDPVWFATALLALDHADGLVAGALSPTSHVLRAALKLIGTTPSISTVSSSMLMLLPDPSLGENGTLLFSDCAVVPEPTPQQLADIGAAAAHTWQSLLGTEPKLAFLSFSSFGSADHPAVERVRTAAELLHKKTPTLKLEGELQVDAALLRGIADIKCPDCQICGEVNTLIFPDLAAGNIGYKLVQRLAGAQAIGPILQGLARPINDLSRGCSTEDIVQTAVITALQAN